MARSNYSPWKGTDKDRGYARRVARIESASPQTRKRTLLASYTTYDDATFHVERESQGEFQIRKNKHGFGVYRRDPV